MLLLFFVTVAIAVAVSIAAVAVAVAALSSLWFILMAVFYNSGHSAVSCVYASFWTMTLWKRVYEARGRVSFMNAFAVW